MEDIANAADDRSRVRRSAQACQRCRTLKARCLPSSEEGTCQRCFRSGYECEWLERRLRQRKQGSSRIVQVEKKIDRLFARIAGSGDSPSTANEPLSGSKALWKDAVLTPAATADQRADVHEDNNKSDYSLDEISRLHDFDLSAEGGRIPAPSRRPADDPLSKTLAAHPEAKELFEQYRSMSASFPFVPIDNEMTVECICTDKPMLLLAIMTVACWRNKRLQMQLERQLRAEVAHRTLIQPRKDLALLQGILVYVAWSHWYLDARVRNPATILHLAVGLLSDLRLLPKSAMNEFEFLPSSSASVDESENRRTVLGCYYLCSTVRVEFSLTTLLEYRDYMHEWSQHLSELCEYDTDSVICLLIESRRIQDVVHAQTSNRTQPSSASSGDGDRMLESYNFWVAKCEDWNRQHGHHEQTRLLDMLRYALESKLHKTLTTILSQENSDSADFKYRQLSSLSSQLEAGKNFFDTLVAVPTDSTHLISFPEWITVPRMVMDMARLSMHSVSYPTEWRTKEAQDRLRLNLYLDSLCFRMHNLTTYNPPEQPHPDYWRIMKDIMQAVNAWYMRKIKAETQTHPSTSCTQNGTGSSGSQYTDGIGTGSADSVGYGVTTPELFDNSFDFLGPSGQGGHCVWLPSHMQMEIDAMNAYNFDWQ